MNAFRAEHTERSHARARCWSAHYRDFIDSWRASIEAAAR
jgi:hypothetical protein